MSAHPLPISAGTKTDQDQLKAFHEGIGNSVNEGDRSYSLLTPEEKTAAGAGWWKSELPSEASLSVAKNQEPRRKRTGYRSRFAPEPQIRIASPRASPQSSGEYVPYSIQKSIAKLSSEEKRQLRLYITSAANTTGLN